ncbi:MAG TPA: hypothetical protein VET48_02520, partial [Steroidobacteraceae bacterium]|nr:hypothetical protein [Steroidobacteraceae bacterium]
MKTRTASMFISLCGSMTLTIICTVAHAAETAVPSYISAAVASPIRPAGDVKRDPNQKPAEVLAFAGVKPGDLVA